MQARRADLHCHLLPGVDDGPRTPDESAVMAAVAAADGTATIVVTPHVRGDYVTDVWELEARVVELSARVAEEGIHLELRRGAELGHDMVGRLDQRELEAIAVGPPGARWLLVETPFEGIDADFRAATEELRDRGFGIVLAHPERSDDVLADSCAALRGELALGVVAQINADSLEGGHGPDAERAARVLVADGLAGLVASDGHGGARLPTLARAFAGALAAGASPDTARRFVDFAPRRLLEHGIRPALPRAA